MLINSENLDIFFHGAKTAFNEAFRTAQPVWPSFGMRVPSAKQAEVHAWLGQWPRLKKWVGTRQYEKLIAHDYTIVNEDFESTIKLNKNDIIADTYGLFMPLARMLGGAVAAHPDELMGELIRQGNRQTCFDGQNFFDSDHPTDSVGTQSNLDGNNADDVRWMLVGMSMGMGTGVRPFVYQLWQPYEFYPIQDLMNDSMLRQIKEFEFGTDGSSNAGYGLWQLAYGSTNDITEARFNTAYAAMQTFKGEGDRPLGVMPRYIVCAPAQRAAAKRIVLPYQAGGASNPNADIVEVIVNPYMA